VAARVTNAGTGHTAALAPSATADAIPDIPSLR
jgi:hypothetical protein